MKLGKVKGAIGLIASLAATILKAKKPAKVGKAVEDVVEVVDKVL